MPGWLSLVLKLTEWNLPLALCLCALAFGGTEPRSLAMVQANLLALGILAIWKGGKITGSGLHWCTRWMPMALLLVVAAQMLPLPPAVAAHVTSRNGLPAGWAPLSAEPHVTLTHFLVLLSAVVAWRLAAAIGTRARRIPVLVYGLIALAAIEALFGLGQYLAGSAKFFWFENKFAMGRAFGSYINPNHYAGLLEMLLPLSLSAGLAATASPGPATNADVMRGGARRPGGRARAAFFLFLSAVVFSGIIASQSRMGIIAALTSLVVTGLWLGLRGLGRKVDVLLAGAFLLVAVSLAVYVGFDPLIARFGLLGGEASIRAEIWRDTLRLIPATFWLGSGYGTFPIVYTAVQTTALELIVNHAHNDYLELAVELGVPVTLAVFAGLFLLVWKLLLQAHSEAPHWRRSLALGVAGSLLALLVHSLADFNLYLPANLLVFAALGGLGAGLIGRPPETVPPS